MTAEPPHRVANDLFQRCTRGTLNSQGAQGSIDSTAVDLRAWQAAAAASVHITPWLRHTVRQITITDFPASWHQRSGERSHDSHTYTERFMMRLDETSQTKLQHLVTQFGASKAEMIRQLIAQAHDDDFPKRWQMRAAERRRQQASQHGTPTARGSQKFTRNKKP
jgi:hypothetical protein